MSKHALQLTCLMVLAATGLAAQSTPRAAAPYDLTGYWVSMVTEDWRWRMTTPPRGDYISIPAGMKHGYTVPADKPALLLSMDAPPYDPQKTIRSNTN